MERNEGEIRGKEEERGGKAKGEGVEREGSLPSGRAGYRLLRLSSKIENSGLKIRRGIFCRSWRKKLGGCRRK